MEETAIPTIRIGAVAYLNARPLVEGLQRQPGVEVVEDVPARLLSRLLAGELHAALCPVIDYQVSPEPLEILPAGVIGSHGPALTVRLFSTVAPEAVTRVHVDGDSHTSVALLRILFSRLHGRRIEVVPTELPRAPASWARWSSPPEAVLVIGDKVIAAPPPREIYGHHVDLGAAWNRLTGLPFVFAVWLARKGAPLGELPEIMARTLAANLERTGEIAHRHAPGAGWPPDLARRYLEEILTYRMGPRELEAVRLFWRMAHEEGLVERNRPLELRPQHPG